MGFCNIPSSLPATCPLRGARPLPFGGEGDEVGACRVLFPEVGGGFRGEFTLWEFIHFE